MDKEKCFSTPVSVKNIKLLKFDEENTCLSFYTPYHLSSDHPSNELNCLLIINAKSWFFRIEWKHKLKILQNRNKLPFFYASLVTNSYFWTVMKISASLFYSNEIEVSIFTAKKVGLKKTQPQKTIRNNGQLSILRMRTTSSLWYRTQSARWGLWEIFWDLHSDSDSDILA